MPIFIAVIMLMISFKAVGSGTADALCQELTGTEWTVDFSRWPERPHPQTIKVTHWMPLPELPE